MLIPESSPNYTYAVKTTLASASRYPLSAALDHPSDHPEDFQLRISYRKYRTSRQIPKGTKPLNLAFCHGNGMNKGLWHYHVDKLYQRYPQLNVVITFDQVNHGDSVPHNQGRLGPMANWNDGAKDVCKVLTVDEGESFLVPNAVNILIGHSMGGFQSLMSAAREPNLFDATILVNAVTDSSDAYRKSFPGVVKKWLEGGYVVSDFDTKGKDWFQVVNDYMKNRSFYKRFHPTVLNNMVYDEYSGLYDPKKSYDKVSLKTGADNQFACYRDGPKSVYDSLPKYGSVTSKVYVLFTSKDLMTPEGRADIAQRLPNAEHLLVPDRFHLFNAEQPDELLEILYKWIDETYAGATTKSIDESGLPGGAKAVHDKLLLDYVTPKL